MSGLAEATRGPLRVGIVGLGGFGELHLRSYLKRRDVEVVGVADTSEERCKYAHICYGIAESFTSGFELVDRLHPDAVSVTTPENAHVDIALYCLSQGVSTLVEKPLADDVSEAKRLLRATETSDAILLPGHVLRFAAPYRSLKDQIEQGAVGRLVAATARRDRRHDIASAYQRTHPALLTMIHDIDLVLWLFATPVLTVQASQVVSAASALQPSFLTATLRFLDGAVAVLSTSFLLPNGSMEANSDRLEVYGTEGVASVDTSFPVTLVQAKSIYAPDLILTPGFANGALDEEISHFCSCAHAKTPSDIMPVSQAVAAVEVASAIVRSSEGGGVLETVSR